MNALQPFILYPLSFIHDNADTFPADQYTGTIDVISGGDPCQPSSVAGRKLGTSDPRYQWPTMFRNIGIIQPRVVVNENVAGTISNGILDQKISDLESIGYTCWPPLIIPANATGAIHERERVFLVAYSERVGLPRQGERFESMHSKEVFFKEADWILNALEENRLPLLCNQHDGVPTRVSEAINCGAGDSIVPQIGYGIFKAIEPLLLSLPSSGVNKNTKQ